jgi:hypothetical protein
VIWIVDDPRPSLPGPEERAEILAFWRRISAAERRRRYSEAMTGDPEAVQGSGAV